MEEEREGVHPGSEGRAVGEEEEDDGREDHRVREILVLCEENGDGIATCVMLKVAILSAICTFCKWRQLHR